MIYYSDEDDNAIPESEKDYANNHDYGINELVILKRENRQLYDKVISQNFKQGRIDRDTAKMWDYPL